MAPSSLFAAFCGVLLLSVATANPSFYGYQPPDPERRGVSVVGPANGLCAGVDDDDSTVTSKSRVYIAQCNGTFSTSRTGANSYNPAWGYLSMQIDNTALIRGADAAYITSPSSCVTDNDAGSCVAGNNILVFTMAGGVSTAYKTVNAAETAGAATYAYASTGGYFGKAGLPGAENGFYAGTATYLATTGTISTNTNSFDIAGTSKTACISQISANTCGAARTFATGAYKFSLFGYTIENTAGAIDFALNNSTGGAFNYLGFRQRISLGGNPAGATLSFTVTTVAGASVDLDAIAGQDASGFRLCVNTDCLSYTFPNQYNYGPLVNSEASNTGAVTGTIKIKISKPPTATCTNCAYVDYLFPVTGLNAPNKWFVYDPDVQPATTTGGTTTGGTTTGGTTSTSGASTMSPWVLGNALVCIATLMASQMRHY